MKKEGQLEFIPEGLEVKESPLAAPAASVDIPTNAKNAKDKEREMICKILSIKGYKKESDVHVTFRMLTDTSPLLGYRSDEFDKHTNRFRVDEETQKVKLPMPPRSLQARSVIWGWVDKTGVVTALPWGEYDAEGRGEIVQTAYNSRVSSVSELYQNSIRVKQPELDMFIDMAPGLNEYKLDNPICKFLLLYSSYNQSNPCRDTTILPKFEVHLPQNRTAGLKAQIKLRQETEDMFLRAIEDQEKAVVLGRIMNLNTETAFGELQFKLTDLAGSQIDLVVDKIKAFESLVHQTISDAVATEAVELKAGDLQTYDAGNSLKSVLKLPKGVTQASLPSYFASNATEPEVFHAYVAIAVALNQNKKQLKF